MKANVLELATEPEQGVRSAQLMEIRLGATLGLNLGESVDFSKPELRTSTASRPELVWCASRATGTERATGRGTEKLPI